MINQPFYVLFHLRMHVFLPCKLTLKQSKKYDLSNIPIKFCKSKRNFIKIVQLPDSHIPFRCTYINRFVRVTKIKIYRAYVQNLHI